MIVTLIPNGTSTPITLSAGGKESPQNLRLNGRRLVQMGEFLRAESAKPFDRKNLTTRITFDVTKSAPSIEAAELAVLQAPKFFCKAGVVEFAIQGGSSAFERFFDAVVESVDCSHKGTALFYSFSIIGGAVEK